MLCDFTKGVPASEILAESRILDRVEFELSQQVVFIIRCHACGCVHSLEFYALDGIPQIPVRLRLAA